MANPSVPAAPPPPPPPQSPPEPEKTEGKAGRHRRRRTSKPPGRRTHKNERNTTPLDFRPRCAHVHVDKYTHVLHSHARPSGRQTPIETVGQWQTRWVRHSGTGVVGASEVLLHYLLARLPGTAAGSGSAVCSAQVQPRCFGRARLAPCATGTDFLYRLYAGGAQGKSETRKVENGARKTRSVEHGFPCASSSPLTTPVCRFR